MPAPRRSRLATALAVLLALESVTVVAVRAAEIRDAGLPAAPAAPASLRAALAGPVTVASSALVMAVRVSTAVRAAASRSHPLDATAIVRRAEPHPGPTSREAESGPAAKPRPAVAAAAASKVTTSPRASSGPSTSFRGRNHVWSPALGIDKAIYSFPCSRSAYPGDVVYRWGCAGRNNVYLFGHAASVFAGLNRAYYTGALKRGLKVYYADSTGRVRTYAVRWWKVVYPTPDVDWAWASLTRPSMTLQTCVGKRSEKRLMVRLVQVSG